MAETLYNASWKYKFAIRDTVGNIGAQSPYHQTMFVQQTAANFFWNAYTIEAGQSNPVSAYSFLRDDNNTDNWHVLVNTASTASTDPNYTSYLNGNWRVDALGFDCNSTSTVYKKSQSNTSKPAGIGPNQLTVINNQISIYPNPSSNNITIQSSTELGTISIYSSLGEINFQTISKNTQEQFDLSELPAGIYAVFAQGKYVKLVKE